MHPVHTPMGTPLGLYARSAIYECILDWKMVRTVVHNAFWNSNNGSGVPTCSTSKWTLSGEGEQREKSMDQAGRGQAA